MKENVSGCFFSEHSVDLHAYDEQFSTDVNIQTANKL